MVTYWYNELLCHVTSCVQDMLTTDHSRDKFCFHCLLSAAEVTWLHVITLHF